MYQVIEWKQDLALSVGTKKHYWQERYIGVYEDLAEAKASAQAAYATTDTPHELVWIAVTENEEEIVFGLPSRFGD